MPRHFVYSMNGSVKPPAGDGDTASWFRFYKWDTEDEVYVPRLRPFYDASPGDYLWFVLDGKVLGSVQILRIELEESQGRQEIWYDASKKLVWHDGPFYTATISSELMDRGPAWLEAATKSASPS